MALDSLGRYTAEHKTWDHVGNMIPVVEYSEGTRPHGEFKPAAWLPVQFFDKYFEDFFVIMPGKVLAFDNSGRIVPAQYGLTGATITYTALDVDAGVIDVRTGSKLLLANIGTFAVSGVDAFMGSAGVAMAVSKPVGVAPYAFWQWAGDGSALDDGFNPAGYRKHNYNLQHRVAVLCDYVLELPLVPAQTASAELTYASYATNVVTCSALANLPVAKNTARTAITFANGTGNFANAATAFVHQVETAAEIKAVGDWHIDLATGVVKVYAASDPGAGHWHITYSNYASAPVGSNVSKFACALGALKAGDFVKVNADSNYVVDASPTLGDSIGQVLEVEDVYNKDALGLVRTAYASIGTDATGSLPGYAGQMDQMPGSATGGVSDKVHYAGAANLVVRINLISR